MAQDRPGRTRSRVYPAGEAVTDTLQIPIQLPPDDYPQPPPGISLTMIVRDEERFLAECLESVKGFVDEICILDTGSKDRTVEIAREYGARVEHMEWPGNFAEARNRSLEMARFRWTLVLDADEEIAEESREALKSIRSIPSYETVIYCRIHNAIDDHGSNSMMSHSLPRLFPTTPRIRYKGIIHEALTIDGSNGADLKAVVTPIRIIHKGYTNDIAAAKEKSKRNAPLLLAAAEDLNDSFAQFNLANYWIAQGKMREGVATLERFAELEVGREPRAYVPLGYVTLACGHAELGNFERAHEVIDICLGLIPSYVLAVFTKGEVYAKEFRWDEAREWFHRTIRVGRQGEDLFFVVDEGVSRWKCQYNIASTFLNQGRWEDAVVWLEIAHSVKPDVWDINQRLTLTYEMMGRFDACEHVYRLSLKSEAAVPAFVGFLCRQGKREDALEIINAHLDPYKGKDPQLGAALHVARAAIKAASGEDKFGDVAVQLTVALHLAFGHGVALTMLDEVYRREGKAAARRSIRESEARQKLVTASDYVRRANRDLFTIPELEDAIAKHPVCVPLFLSLAMAHGTADKAARVLADCPIKDPDVAEVCTLIVAAYLEREGRFEEALAKVEGVIGDHATLLRVKILDGLGRSDEAEDLLRDMTDNRQAKIELAAMLLRHGNPVLAKTEIYEALNAAG